MTSGFSLPFPTVLHADNPDNDPQMIYAFHFWLAADLTGPSHLSRSRYECDFMIWDLIAGAIRFDSKFLETDAASVGYDATIDSAVLVPKTATDFYYANRGFEIRGVMTGLVEKNASLIFRYSRLFEGSETLLEDNEIWKYGKDPHNVPVPPYGTGDLRVNMALETGSKKLGPLINDREFVGYGSRLIADDGKVRTIYRFYTKQRPKLDTNFVPNTPEEIHPSLTDPARTFVGDLWMRGDPAGPGYAATLEGGRTMLDFKVIEGEMYFAPNKYPSSEQPCAQVLPKTASDWMVRTPIGDPKGPHKLNIQLRMIWKTAGGYPLWILYSGGLEDDTEFEAYTANPVEHPQIPFGVGGFNAVLRMLTEDPELQWVTKHRFHAHGTRILQSDATIRTTYKVYKENTPVDPTDLEMTGRFWL